MVAATPCAACRLQCARANAWRCWAANGVGKTTLLRTLSGLVKADGRITFDGRPILGRRPEWIVRCGVSHVPQGRGCFAELTVEENLRVGAFTRRDAAGIARDIRHWYEVFPRLGERRDQPAGQMSGGEQQMLAIARALMSRPGCCCSTSRRSGSPG